MLKTRVKCQHFIDGNAPVGKTTVTAAFIVEVQRPGSRHWLPLGDNGKVTKYHTREAAQAEADLVSKMEVATS